jgi:membrane associated rhomboid family serine protease
VSVCSPWFDDNLYWQCGDGERLHISWGRNSWNLVCNRVCHYPNWGPALALGSSVVIVKSQSGVFGRFSSIVSSDSSCPPPQVVYTGVSIVVQAVACGSGLSTGAIVGIAIGCAVAGVLIALSIGVLLAYSNRKRTDLANIEIRQESMKNLKLQ